MKCIIENINYTNKFISGNIMIINMFFIEEEMILWKNQKYILQ